jgi:ribosome biogenesis GTPase
VTGRVLACYHDEWEVALSGGDIIRCHLRGRHFSKLTDGQKPVVPGDLVELGLLRDGSGVIERTLPRETVLSRLLPGRRRPVEQIIISNVKQLVTVASLGTPSLNRRLLDRFLVISEAAGLRSVVVFNKTDLVPEKEWRPAAAAYENAGYEVIPTSATNGTNVDRLASVLAGTFSVLAGPSGAGKSSLLNAIRPGLGLRVKEISRASGKGKHATTNVTVFRLGDGILVADTPGFRELGFWRIRPGDLDYFFPEFRDYIMKCRFRGCSHSPEPGCAIKEAVETGALNAARYDSYLRLLEELRKRA